MVETAASFAFDEIALVLFTSLTPTGVAAAMFIVAALIKEQGEAAVRLRRRLWIPLLVAMVGLVASASHLGTPANALYVLDGLGRSPLSNEVVSGVVFLGLLGIYWYASYGRKGGGIEPVWRIALLVSGALFLLFMSVAYAAESIVTWNVVWAPLSLLANALLGGALLAVLVLRIAEVHPSGLERRLLVASVGALVVNVVVYGAWGSQLPVVGNYLATASDLAPYFGPSVILFAALAAVGVGLVWSALRNGSSKVPWKDMLGCALVLLAVFLMRFQFYMMHATAGLGV